MRKLRYAFSIAFIAVLFLPMVSLAVQFAGADIPDWLGRGDGSSRLEGRAYTPLPDVDAQSLLSGAFQEQSESFMADSVPNRDAVLLGNAALQRMGISATADVLGYDLYPAFYGLNKYYWESHDLIVKQPIGKSQGNTERFEESARLIAEMGQRHPNVNVVVCGIEQPDYCEFNPLWEEFPNCVDSAYMHEAFYRHLGTGVKAVEAASASQDEMIERFYRGDHHLNTVAAYVAYAECITVLEPGAEPVEVSGVHEIEGLDFQGANARIALMPLKTPDSMCDIEYDASELTVKTGDETGDGTLLVQGEDNARALLALDRFDNCYCSYFHNDRELMTIENADAPIDETLVVVRDSYSTPVDRLFAEHYRNVWIVDSRKYDGTLEEVLAESGAENVLFFMGYSDYHKDELVTFMQAQG